MRIPWPLLALLALLARGAVQGAPVIKDLGPTVHDPVIRADGMVFWTASDAIKNEAGPLVAKPPPNQVGDNPYGAVFDANQNGFLNQGSFSRFEQPTPGSTGLVFYTALYLN